SAGELHYLLLQFQVGQRCPAAPAHFASDAGESKVSNHLKLIDGIAGSHADVSATQHHKLFFHCGAVQSYDRKTVGGLCFWPDGHLQSVRSRSDIATTNEYRGAEVVP